MGGPFDPPPWAFKFEAYETFSTCSLIMSASFDVNWMMSSLIIYS